MKMQGVALAGGLEPRTQTSSGRRLLGHLHNFRGLAIAFIVATHCMSMFDWSDSPELRNVLARVVANGTIFFIFISGYLFHYLSHDFRALDYWLKKLRFVVLPYSLVSIPAILIFGIFFLHSYVITSVKRVTEHLGLAQPRGGVIELCVAACLMLGLTMGLVMLLKNMLGVRSRMVIGV